MIKYHIYNQGINTLKDVPNKNILTVIHNAGYFSNLTIRLLDLVTYMQKNGSFPDEIDSSVQFSFYKDEAKLDVSKYYFKEIDTDIPFSIPNVIMDCMGFQFNDYKDLDFDRLNPIIEKYFTPGETITSKVDYLKDKYNLTEYCSVFYRGNDKQTETITASYETFFKKCEEIRANDPNIPFLVQPDECNFLAEFKNRFDNVISFDETPCIDNKNSCVFFEIEQGKKTEYGAWYNAAVLLLSKGKHLVTHSANGGVWAALYRGNSINIHQCFNDKFYE